MTTPPARPLAPYVIGFLGVGLALAGTVMAGDLWPDTTLGDDESGAADKHPAYLVGLVGWGFASALWAIAVLITGRKP